MAVCVCWDEVEVFLLEVRIEKRVGNEVDENEGGSAWERDYQPSRLQLGVKALCLVGKSFPERSSGTRTDRESRIAS